MDEPQSNATPAGPPSPDGARTSGSRRWRRSAAALLALTVLAVLAPLFVPRWLARFGGELRSGVERALAERVPRARLQGGVRLDPRMRIVAGPIVVPARRAGAPPVIRIERVSVRPRFSALLRGRVEASLVAFDGVHVEPGAGFGELEALVDEMPRGAAWSGPAPSAAIALPLVVFSGLTGSVPRPDGAPLSLGPYQGALRLARADDGQPSATWRVRLPGGGTLEGAAQASGPREAPFTVRVSGAWLRWKRLATEPIGPVGGVLSGILRWDPGARRVALDEGRLALSERAVVALRAAVELHGEGTFQASARAAELDWAAALAALPRALRPPPDVPAVTGLVRATLTVSGPLRRPGAWRFDGDLDLSGLAPASGGPRLDLPFVYRAPLSDGATRALEVGPRNAGFVPLAELPRHLVRAVTTSEDAGFFAHHGFDLSEIRDALARGNGGARLRGASTISQQLAKNLYLSPERTLARKAREALATIALETCVDKRRLLEIYLNLAEWGDGVFGVGEAARHWFGKDARLLSPKEAAFLATVIPNPVRYEMYRRRGALTPAWEERVHDLLLKLRAAEVLTDEELRDAWDEPLSFARG